MPRVDKTTVFYSVPKEEVILQSFPRMKIFSHNVAEAASSEEPEIPEAGLDAAQDDLTCGESGDDDWVWMDELKKPKGYVEDLINLFGGGTSTSSGSEASGSSKSKARSKSKQSHSAELPEQPEPQKEEESHPPPAPEQSPPRAPETSGPAVPVWMPYVEEPSKDRGIMDEISNIFKEFHHHHQQPKTKKGFIAKACECGSKIMEVGFDIAAKILSDDTEEPPHNEDNVMFNGYKVLVSGRLIRMDAVRRNFPNPAQLEVVAKFIKMKRSFIKPELNLSCADGNGTWCLDFGESAGFVQIQAPSGVDVNTITYEGPYPEGVLIVNMPCMS